MTRKHDQTFRMEAASLPLGSTVCVECPGCGRHKCYITRSPEGLLYYCQRAGCDIRGFVGDLSDNAATVPVHTMRPLNVNYLSPTNLEADWFVDKIGFYPPGVRVVDDGRYVLPIRDPVGRIRGRRHGPDRHSAASETSATPNEKCGLIRHSVGQRR